MISVVECYIDDVEVFLPNLILSEYENFVVPIASEEICREICLNATTYRCVGYMFYYDDFKQCFTFSKTPAEGLKTQYNDKIGLKVLTCVNC
jgi:hypothetical protein